MARDAVEVFRYLQRNGSSRVETMANALDWESRRFEKPIRDLTRIGAILRAGDKRWTEYAVASGGEEAVAEKLLPLVAA